MDLFESGGVGGLIVDLRYRDRVLSVTAAHLGRCKCTEGVGRAVYSGGGREARKIF